MLTGVLEREGGLEIFGKLQNLSSNFKVYMFSALFEKKLNKDGLTRIVTSARTIDLSKVIFPLSTPSPNQHFGKKIPQTVQKKRFLAHSLSEGTYDRLLLIGAFCY